jgi:cell division protein FtsB
MQEDKNSNDYQALQSELTKLRQENKRLKKKIKKIRLQSTKDKIIIDYLDKVISLTREM